MNCRLESSSRESGDLSTVSIDWSTGLAVLRLYIRSHFLATPLCKWLVLPLIQESVHDHSNLETLTSVVRSMHTLNESKSAGAATPATRMPDAARRFATFSTVKRSGMVKALVSVSG